jgi:hypothetical protein
VCWTLEKRIWPANPAPLTLGAVNVAAEFAQPFALAALVALLGMIAALVLLPDA